MEEMSGREEGREEATKGPFQLRDTTFYCYDLQNVQKFE